MLAIYSISINISEFSEKMLHAYWIQAIKVPLTFIYLYLNLSLALNLQYIFVISGLSKPVKYNYY